MEIFEDSTPFVYDKARDQVVYRRDFGHINPETMYPGAEQFVDASKISKVTTWNPNKGPAAPTEYFHLVGNNSGKMDAIDGGIDFLFHGKMWFCNPIVQIGVFNSKPEEGPIDFTIRMRDMAPEATYPEHVQ